MKKLRTLGALGAALIWGVTLQACGSGDDVDAGGTGSVSAGAGDTDPEAAAESESDEKETVAMTAREPDRTSGDASCEGTCNSAEQPVCCRYAQHSGTFKLTFYSCLASESACADRSRGTVID